MDRHIDTERSCRVTGSAAAPVVDFPGALGRVKVTLAALAADATLTRPARSRLSCNYQSDGIIGLLNATGRLHSPQDGPYHSRQLRLNSADLLDAKAVKSN